nr:MAG TPA: hypothetical protein [Bacteriophage sp.]
MKVISEITHFKSLKRLFYFAYNSELHNMTNFS